MNIQDWFRLGLTSLISLQSKGLSRVFSNPTVQKASILWCSAFFMVQLSHPYMTTRKIKTIALTRRTFVSKVMSLLYNMLSRFVTAFLPRSKHLLIPWLHSYKKNCLSILVIWQPTLPDMYSYTNILIINIYLVHCLPFFLLKIFQVLIFKMHLL